jgi:hypothetical protein
VFPHFQRVFSVRSFIRFRLISPSWNCFRSGNIFRIWNLLQVENIPGLVLSRGAGFCRGIASIQVTGPGRGFLPFRRASVDSVSSGGSSRLSGNCFQSAFSSCGRSTFRRTPIVALVILVLPTHRGLLPSESSDRS